MTRLIDAFNTEIGAIKQGLKTIQLAEGDYGIGFGMNEIENAIVRLQSLITNVPTVQREGWVSVTDDMPKKVCLAYYKNELGNGRTVKAKYTEQYSEEANTDDDWVEYNEADDTYYYPAGWYEMIDNWDDFTFVTINYEVTHWQPLPSAPTDKE